KSFSSVAHRAGWPTLYLNHHENGCPTQRGFRWVGSTSARRRLHNFSFCWCGVPQVSPSLRDLGKNHNPRRDSRPPLSSRAQLGRSLSHHYPVILSEADSFACERDAKSKDLLFQTALIFITALSVYHDVILRKRLPSRGEGRPTRDLCICAGAPEF